MRWRQWNKTQERWQTKLAAIRAEQHLHPGKGAEVWFGDPSTAYLYRQRLAAGTVPSNASEIPLDTSGFAFVVRSEPNARTRSLLAMWVGDGEPDQTWLNP